MTLKKKAEEIAKQLWRDLVCIPDQSELDAVVGHILPALTETDAEAYRRGWNEGIEKCATIIRDATYSMGNTRFDLMDQIRALKLPAEAHFTVEEIPDKGLRCVTHARKFVVCERHLLSTKSCEVSPEKEAGK